MEFFKINSKAFKSPTSIEHSFEVLDKEERTMDGTMVVDEIGKKNTVTVKWAYLAKSDMSFLSEELKSSFVSISFIDKATGLLKTINVRASSPKYQTGYDWVNEQVLWKNVSVSFSER